MQVVLNVLMIASFVLFVASLFVISIEVARKESVRPGVSGLIFAAGLWILVSGVTFAMLPNQIFESFIIG